MAEAAQPTNQDAQTARYWIAELDAAEHDKDRVRWVDRCKQITKLYKEERAETDRRRKKYALFWSNIQTLAPAVYARTPTAVVGRRFKDADPTGRVASEVLERALLYSSDAENFAQVMLGCRDEYLLYARAQAWVRYVPSFAARAQDPGQITDSEEDPGEEDEVVQWEEVEIDRVHFDDFIHNPARSWGEVRWVARRAYLTRAELVKRFPDCGNEVPLDYKPEGREPMTEGDQKGAVYEVWDTVSRKVFWVSKGYPQKPLDQRDDPLGLPGFFPCPRPLLGTTSPDSIVPTPDFIYYQDQVDEVNTLTARIDKLVDALKVRGFYAASQKDNLNNLLSSDDNTMIPVDSWAALGDSGGLKGVVEWFPLDLIAATLKECIATRKQIIDDVYQITGISDIMRGDTDPNETATGQQLKSSWGSSRVRDRQKELARFSRDLLRIAGQIIASKFGQDILVQMTGVQLLTAQQKQQIALQMQIAQQTGQQPPVPPNVLNLMGQPSWDDVMRLLRDAELRSFHIDIETDSTIEPNDQEEKQRRIEFIGGLGEYLAKSLPVVQAAPPMLPVVVEGLKFLVRGFRVGREMEEVIDRALDQLEQAAQNPQPQGADPAEQAKAQAAQTTAQAHLQQAQNDAQANQVEMARVQSDHALGAAQIQAENARTAAQIHADHTMHGQSLQADMQQAIIKAEERRLIGEINAKTPAKASTP